MQAPATDPATAFRFALAVVFGGVSVHDVMAAYFVACWGNCARRRGILQVNAVAEQGPGALRAERAPFSFAVEQTFATSYGSRMAAGTETARLV